MSRREKLLKRARENPKNVRFSDLCQLVRQAGYELVGQRGSHRSYRREGAPILTLQEGRGGKAKPYQVRQVLDAIDALERTGLEEEDEE